MVAGARIPARRAARDARSRRSGRTTGSRSGCPTARCLRRIEALLFPDADEVEELVVGQVASGGALRLAASARTPAGRCSCRVAGPGRGRRSGSSASAQPTCSRSPRATAASRSSSRRIARCCRTSSTCRPCARCSAASPGARSPSTRSRRRGRSPFASSLLFDYVAAYMYDGDAPLAERRAGALTLDRDLLRELLGQEELRELLDPDALADLELSLQALTDDRRATTADQLHDLLRRLGDLSADEIAARSEGGAAAGDALADRARRLAPGGAGPDRRRRSLDRDRGCRPLPRRRRGLAAGRRPRGVPRSGDGGARWAARPLRPDPRPVPDTGSGAPLGPAGRRRRGRARAAARGRDDPARRVPARRRRARVDRSGRPAARSGGGRSRGFAARSSRSIRRRSAGSCPPGTASRRSGSREAALAARSPRSSGSPRSSTSSPACAIPASVLERDVLPARIPGYQPRLLDELGAMGEVAWVGRGSLGRDDGRIALYRPGREVLRPTGPADGVDRPAGPRHDAIRAHLPGGAPRSTASSSSAAGGGPDREVLDALWDLVWAGEVTNDTFAPLRALRWKRPARDARRRPGRLTSLGPPEAAGRWSLVEPDDPAEEAWRRSRAWPHVPRRRSDSTPSAWRSSTGTGS